MYVAEFQHKLQQLLGTPQFNEGLIFGRIDEEALKELLEALEVLAGAWKSRAKISRLLLTL